jgi:hypothetical protein
MAFYAYGRTHLSCSSRTRTGIPTSFASPGACEADVPCIPANHLSLQRSPCVPGVCEGGSVCTSLSLRWWR